jgi:AraC family transcriptional activator of tynA and feaB
MISSARCSHQLTRGPSEKLSRRIRRLIRDRLADPDFGPADVTAEVGLSLRYVQKLFTERGSTCSEFIYSLQQAEVDLLW